MMQNLLADTNIYGEMVIDIDIEKLKQALSKNQDLIIFGSPIVRKELRSTPKKIKIGGSNLRIDLLSLYDLITKERNLEITSETEEMANYYFSAYLNFGGSQSMDEMIHDFLIVASASLKNMDIVVSNDESTLKSDHSLKAYALVNSIKKLRNPKFINYQQFKELLR